LHAFGFGLGCGDAVRGDAVVAAALVVEVGVWALFGFFDQALFEEAVDVAVEEAGAGVELVLCAGEDFTFESVAVTFTLEERKEEMEGEGGKVF